MSKSSEQNCGGASTSLQRVPYFSICKFSILTTEHVLLTSRAVFSFCNNVSNATILRCASRVAVLPQRTLALAIFSPNITSFIFTSLKTSRACLATYTTNTQIQCVTQKCNSQVILCPGTGTPYIIRYKSLVVKPTLKTLVNKEHVLKHSRFLREGLE